MPASLKLNEVTGNKERYPIKITIAAGHKAIKGEAACHTSVLSHRSNVVCAAKFAPGKPKDLLSEILAKVDADKPAGSTVDTTGQIQAEYWMGDGHTAIEDELKDGNQVAGAYAKYHVNLPKDGPVAARTEYRTTKIWKPSDAIKAALLTEAGGAVTKMMGA